ncbi:FCS-Like Zinc finger 3 [Malania oleifera]|uniref:FCS-Like Zinc finger 3 n=1 Tax=Malania oleifera TaxID=397392 RepID=UPI0025AEAC4D|nr:FCS-Like Zinc finger 3 [Malania oleifera]
MVHGPDPCFKSSGVTWPTSLYKTSAHLSPHSLHLPSLPTPPAQSAHPVHSSNLQPDEQGAHFTMRKGYGSSPRSNRLSYVGWEEHPQPHFLEACFLCQKPLGNNSDIFMYRGNTPFCSKECRQEQIEKDEEREKSWSLSSSKRPHRTADSKKSSPSKTVQTGTVAVA